MLQLRGVSFRYPGAARNAITSIDLEIAPGEVLGVVGPNDAGKSTLCLVAAGLAPRSTGGTLSGEIVVPSDTPPGIVFQDPVTQRSGVTATVFEEVALGPVNLGSAVADSMAATRTALRAVGIVDLAERHPAHLSGGQGQLLAIASALAIRPSLLVLDEPTAQLDDEATIQVVDALRALAASGTALLVAEHRTEVLGALEARTVRLEGGRIGAGA
jgi:energy-coupling factor transport system ATP-binding protein